MGKACGWKHPKVPSVKRLWKDKAIEAVLAFLEDTGVGCIVTKRKPREEECGGEGLEGEGARPGPP